MKNKLYALSLISISASLFLAACGSRVTGTYNLTQIGNSLNPNCQNVTLNVTNSANRVTGVGSSNGCTESFSGTDNGTSITVDTFTVNSNNSYGYNYVANCVYSGQLIVSGNQVSGVLTPNMGAATASPTPIQGQTGAYNNGYGYGYNYNSYNYCQPISVSGTRN